MNEAQGMTLALEKVHIQRGKIIENKTKGREQGEKKMKKIKP